MEPSAHRPAFAAPRTLVLIGLIVAATLTRLLPHEPNFSPIEATALFAGAYFFDRRLALLVPLVAMAISDLFLGLHAGIPVVYGCMALMAWFGRGLMERRSALRIAGYGLAGAVFFFVVTNLFVWATQAMYPMTFDGLVACYVAAIPFFRNSLAGVAVYSLVLFGGFALAEHRVARLAAAPR